MSETELPCVSDEDLQKLTRDLYLRTVLFDDEVVLNILREVRDRTAAASVERISELKAELEASCPTK